MKPPIHSLPKRELVFLATHYCKHGHTFLEHYGCYARAQEKIGFLDIEASNLVADFGIILSWCIKEKRPSANILHDVVKPADIKRAKTGDEDRRVTRTLVAAMQKFDRIVTFYGKRFDVPFIRTRALSMGLAFPEHGALYHTDLYFTVRHRFKLSSNRLENACRVLLNKTNKTRIDAKYWRAGVRGDAKSLEYILDHNKKDVIDLENLYDKLVGVSPEQKVSA